MVRNTMMREINKNYTQDQWFKEPYENLEKEHKTLEIKNIYQAYILDGGVPYYGIRVRIPHFKDFHVIIFYDCCNIPITNHLGF
jgi:hypothetical protein